MMEAKDKPVSLIGLAWPIFVGMLAQNIIYTIDTLMLSRYSDGAVAAIGTASQILGTANFIFGFINVGLAILVAQLLGSGKKREAARLSSVALGANFVLGLIISIALIGFAGPLLEMIHMPPELMEDGHTFLVTVGVSTFAVAVSMTAETILRMNGLVKRLMLLSFATIVINTLGNYLVLFQPFGLPSYGVQGVALATVVSRMVGLGAVLYMLFMSLKHYFDRRDLFLSPIRDLKEMLKLGIPSGGESLSYTASQIVITVITTMLGTSMMTAKIYTQNMTAFVFMVCIAFGQAVSILIGRLIGAGNHAEAYRSGFRYLRIGMLITLGFSSLLYAGADLLIKLFTSNAEIISTAKTLLLLSIVLEVARACNVLVISSLNAAGDVRYPVLVSLIFTWGLSLPLAYLFSIQWNMGITGIWIAFIIDEWIRGLLMIIRWRQGKWRDIRLAVLG